MDYRTLGRTGVKVSPLCLGTMNFADRTSEEESKRILDIAIDHGINLVDTADFYGQVLNDGAGMGHTEERLGRYFSSRGNRNRMILATKFLYPTDWDDPNARGGSRRHVIDACEDSLRRLQTDHIDLYQMHSPDPRVPIDETLRALDDLIHAGKILYLGTSRFSAWQIVEALWQSKELGLNRFISEQVKYSILRREAEGELFPMTHGHDIAILAYQTLAAGLFSGKYQRGKDLPEESRYADPSWSGYKDSYLTDHGLDVVEALSRMAESKGCTVSQLASAWALHRPEVTSVIIGPRTVEQLKDSLGILDVEWTAEDLAGVDEVSPGPSKP
ncbi:aldo/keto reductase [Candidatus Bipolaricaulota bacterium]